MLAQIDLTQLANPKALLATIAGMFLLLVAMVLGRFIYAFKSGAGLKGAWIAVFTGTNTPQPPVQPPTISPQTPQNQPLPVDSGNAKT